MDESGTSEARVTIEEAARLLGIEKQSVKKRIQRGKLRSESDAKGTTWVYVDTSETVQDRSRDQSGTGRDAPMVDELRGQVAYLREQLRREQDAHAEARRIIAGLVQRVPELEAAPQERPQAPETVQERPEGAAPRSGTPGPQEGSQRRWWEFWR